MLPESAIEVTVPLTPAYSSRTVTLWATQANIRIPLIEGSGRISTGIHDVGRLASFGNKPLRAALSVWYEYDPKRKSITFCANDFISPDSTFLSTELAGTDETFVVTSYKNDAIPDSGNLFWDPATPLTPGLVNLLRETVRGANDAIMAKAKTMLSIVGIRQPFRELPQEVYESLCPVYHRGEFEGFFDPRKNYGAEHVIVHLKSQFDKVEWWGKDQNFANAKGTTEDPKDEKAGWITLWKANCNRGSPPRSCASEGWYSRSGLIDQVCSSRNIGGHVVTGTRPYFPLAGSGDVSIIPICDKHNQLYTDDDYMQTQGGWNVARLKNYNRPIAPLAVSDGPATD